MPKRLLPWMALCACSPLLAAPTVPEARLQQLAADPYWIALGHYERGKLGGWRSYVDDERFFLADNGESHPDAELAATLKALYASPSLGDKHAQCVYPARTRWLRQQLQLDDLPQPQCGEYDNWYRDINPHSAVLVFPAAYLNSPSSMFGHTLLRIDQADVTSNNTALLSYALNFGAYIEGMDNSILYAWKGLMGGYPGLFALVPYREKLAEYSRLENRDLWEYKLNLTPEETGRMVEHVWELKQVRFDYYFFDENCSFRLLELMEIARPGIELTEQFPLTAIPTDTVRAVKNAGLIERIDYRPSREKELLARAEPLDHAERDWAKRLADDDSLLDAPDFKALPMPRQALIQDAAFRLVRSAPPARRVTAASPRAATTCCERSTATRRRTSRSSAPASRKTATSHGPGSSASAAAMTAPSPSTACAWPTMTSPITPMASPSARRSRSASSSCASTKATAGSCRISTWSPSAR